MWGVFSAKQRRRGPGSWRPRRDRRRSAMHAAVSILLAAGIGVAGAVSPGAVGPVGVAASQAQTSASAAEGPGGPILVVTEPADPFGDYYAEILRAEGLNEFALTTATASRPRPSPAPVVVLAANDALTAARRTADQWVRTAASSSPCGRAPSWRRCSVWAATGGARERVYEDRHRDRGGRRHRPARRCSSMALRIAGRWRGRAPSRRCTQTRSDATATPL